MKVDPLATVGAVTSSASFFATMSGSLHPGRRKRRERLLEELEAVWPSSRQRSDAFWAEQYRAIWSPLLFGALFACCTAVAAGGAVITGGGVAETMEGVVAMASGGAMFGCVISSIIHATLTSYLIRAANHGWCGNVVEGRRCLQVRRSGMFGCTCVGNHWKQLGEELDARASTNGEVKASARQKGG